MDTQDVKAGMFVEYQMNLSEVIGVDRKTKSAVIQRHSDNQKMTVDVADLFADRQLNSATEMYYWG